MGLWDKGLCRTAHSSVLHQSWSVTSTLCRAGTMGASPGTLQGTGHGAGSVLLFVGVCSRLLLQQ